MNSAFVFTDGAEFSFLEGKSHRFEDAIEGEVLKHEFVFINSGDHPLMISSYKVACSCTVISFPEEPVLPGEKGVLSLSFDTNGKYGFQKRKIEIVSNAKKSITLLFKVVVIPKEAVKE